MNTLAIHTICTTHRHTCVYLWFISSVQNVICSWSCNLLTNLANLSSNILYVCVFFSSLLLLTFEIIVFLIFKHVFFQSVSVCNITPVLLFNSYCLLHFITCILQVHPDAILVTSCFNGYRHITAYSLILQEYILLIIIIQRKLL